MSKGQTLQDPFLNALRKDRIPVSIFLVNGIKLQGQIESFDQYSVLLKNTVSQMVYKHAISTIVPVRNPRTSDNPTGNNGYQGQAGSSNYPMTGATTGFGGGFDRGNTGGFTRGGFTRTPNAGFGGGFDRGYGNQGFDRGNTGAFTRTSSGFGGGFDRSNFEERGFDGQTFDNEPSKHFDNKAFDDKAFDDNGFNE